MLKAVIGIDLGTVNSCVATYDGANVQITQISKNRITPSYVYYDPKTPNIYYGNGALSTVNKNVIYDAKRFVGRRFQDEIVQKIYPNYPFSITAGTDNDIYFEVPYNNDSVKKKPEEISAELLRYIKEEVCLKYDVDDVEAVITVPAHFNNNQRDKTKQAATKAGIKVLKLMNEPTAAALSYFHAGFKKNLKAMVFDLGGGTFDISIIEINDDDIIVKATDGDTFLGGRNFDENIMNHLKGNLEKEGKVVGNLENCRLKQLSKKLKETLSMNDEADDTIFNFIDGEDEEFNLNKETFDKINQNDFDKCLQLIERCLNKNNIKREEIVQVIMVGGSSRIPRLKEMVGDYFGNDKLMCDLDPDEAVAGGAAIQAFIMTNKDKDTNCSDILSAKMWEQLTIIDVNSLTLGVGVRYDEMSIIIPRNTPLPVSNTKKYYTIDNYQSRLSFSIYEGERACVKFNNLLGKLKIKNIPKKPARQVSADVTFTIDDDGILNVTAKCVGQEENLTITLNQYDLYDVEVRSRISDEQDNADYDRDFKNFVKAKRNLNKILQKYSFSKDLKNLLWDTSMEEKENITRELNEVTSLKLLTKLKTSWDSYLHSS